MQRPTRKALTGFAALSLAGVLVGCEVGPAYRTPDISVPRSFVASTTATTHGSTELDSDHWWHAFHDAELDSLIERAVRANPDVQIALARLQEARAQQSVRLSDALPEAAASAAAGHGTGSDLSRSGAAAPLRAADNKGSLSQIRQVAGFAATWELDLFGGYRRAAEAARDDAQAAAAARALVITSVEADVARNYITLRGSQTRLDILRDNIATARAFRNLQQVRVDRGLVNELDLRLAERELATLRAEAPPLQSQLSAAQYNIAALMGQYPEQLSTELSGSVTLPYPPRHVAAGLPLAALQRRPDVHEAERQLAAATARIGVATANLFPHVTLTGALGTQSGTIGAHGTHIFGFGPTVYWPLLDFGALDAEVEAADYRAQSQLIAYKKAVVAAVKDADAAITNFDAQEARLTDLDLALSASQRAVELARQRYERGLTDFLNVDDAERQQYNIQDELTRAREETALAFVGLCQALGGGWQSYQSVPPIRHPEPAFIAGPRTLLSRGER